MLALIHMAVRPRWHDAVIVSAIVGVFALGVWALWWDDVRAFMGWKPAEETVKAPVPRGQT